MITEMAGRSKTLEKKLENIKLGPLQKSCDELVKATMAKKHPQQLTEAKQKGVDQMLFTNHDQWKGGTEAGLKAIINQCLIDINNNLDEIPTRHKVYAVKMLYDALKDIRGEATQRIEVKRDSLKHDEFNKLYETFADEAEVIDGETTGRKELGGSSDLSQRKGEETSQ